MAAPPTQTAVILLCCPGPLARKGVVVSISNFILAHKGSILYTDDYQDSALDLFLSRLEWDLDGFDIPMEDFDRHFQPVAGRFLIQYQVALSAYRPKVAILVSSYDHCLADLLYRHRTGELACEIPVIISNHTTGQPLAEFYGIPFHAITDAKDKSEAEQRILASLRQHGIDLIVLARYMQILSPEFVQQFPWRIINIHHSFLPAFVGSRPYHQAFERGVKIIGATSHYVTADLDEGPIIEQDVVRVSHRDTVEDLIQKGRDLEKVVLSRAVRWHIENRILLYANKTVVFT
ncbi:MAG TPA: formyltetrahydrofolate deformylase [Candidatus Acidoferrales bacterium]|jgi:formyltetrahydrofolate deformylase|nr:formyltetrahydrofolate deformylase [Candidatus Acidoferrales bacterium]